MVEYAASFLRWPLLQLLSIHDKTMPAKLDLDEWRIVLDREDSGLDESWFATAFSETETVKPPGSLQAQGFGDDSGINTPWTGDIRQEEWTKPIYAPCRTDDKFKMPFWLQPEKCR